MDDPSNHVDGESERAPRPVVGDVPSTERYETEDAVVLYDADNPLAWIQASETVTLDDAA